MREITEVDRLVFNRLHRKQAIRELGPRIGERIADLFVEPDNLTAPEQGDLAAMVLHQTAEHPPECVIITVDFAFDFTRCGHALFSVIRLEPIESQFDGTVKPRTGPCGKSGRFESLREDAEEYAFMLGVMGVG
jgi:hypothetical protein